MNHVSLVGSDIDRQNMSRHPGGESKQARFALSGIFGHKNRSAACHALEHPKEPPAPELRAGLKLNGAAHPRQFSRNSHYTFAGLKLEFEDGQCRANNAVIHELRVNAGLLRLNQKRAFPALERNSYANTEKGQSTAGLA